jgi:hypothetical protein
MTSPTPALDALQEAAAASVASHRNYSSSVPQTISIPSAQAQAQALERAALVPPPLKLEWTPALHTKLQLAVAQAKQGWGEPISWAQVERLFDTQFYTADKCRKAYYRMQHPRPSAAAAAAGGNKKKQKKERERDTPIRSVFVPLDEKKCRVMTVNKVRLVYVEGKCYAVAKDLAYMCEDLDHTVMTGSLASPSEKFVTGLKQVFSNSRFIVVTVEGMAKIVKEFPEVQEAAAVLAKMGQAPPPPAPAPAPAAVASAVPAAAAGPLSLPANFLKRSALVENVVRADFSRLVERAMAAQQQVAGGGRATSMSVNIEDVRMEAVETFMREVEKDELGGYKVDTAPGAKEIRIRF